MNCKLKYTLNTASTSAVKCMQHEFVFLWIARRGRDIQKNSLKVHPEHENPRESSGI